MEVIDLFVLHSLKIELQKEEEKINERKATLDDFWG